MYMVCLKPRYSPSMKRIQWMLFWVLESGAGRSQATAEVSGLLRCTRGTRTWAPCLQGARVEFFCPLVSSWCWFCLTRRNSLKVKAMSSSSLHPARGRSFLLPVQTWFGSVHIVCFSSTWFDFSSCIRAVLLTKRISSSGNKHRSDKEIAFCHQLLLPSVVIAIKAASTTKP